jgi:hypothetical protein
MLRSVFGLGKVFLFKSTLGHCAISNLVKNGHFGTRVDGDLALVVLKRGVSFHAAVVFSLGKAFFV